MKIDGVAKSPEWDGSAKIVKARDQGMKRTLYYAAMTRQFAATPGLAIYALQDAFCDAIIIKPVY